MRVILFAVALAGALGVSGVMSPAKAWYDHWGRWHPGHGYYWHHGPYWHAGPYWHHGPYWHRRWYR